MAGLLFWLALVRAAPPEAACAQPGELAAAAGWTLEVGCVGANPPLRGPARPLFGLPLDPNAADPATLETLPGIGPARARAIVSERRERPFAAVDELVRVPGIGPRTLAAIAPWLAIDPAPASQPPGAAGPGRRPADRRP